MMNPGLVFDVRYLDDDFEERGVGLGRIAMDMEPVETQLRVSTIEYESSQMIMGIAQRLATCLYMARDNLVERDRTLNDRLFLVESGSIISYGLENPLNPLKMTRSIDGDYIGDDISVLVAGHEASPRWYTARCSIITRVHVLTAETFLDIIEHPSLKTFKKNISRYGKWIHLKYEFLKAIKTGRLHGDVLASWLTDGPSARRRAVQTDNEAVREVAKRVDDVEAKLDRVLRSQRQTNDQLARILNALGGGGYTGSVVDLSSRVNGLATAAAAAPSTPIPEAPIMSSFNLDDFLEPINNNGHGAGRPASASKAALQEFFCGTNGDDQERRP